MVISSALAVALLFAPLILSFSFIHNGRSRPSCLHVQFENSVRPVPQLSHVESSGWTSSTSCFMSEDDLFVEADNLPAVQELFNAYCDSDGLMTKAALEKMPPFRDYLVSARARESYVQACDD